MFGDLFDSPWKILIVAVVILVLFGSAKLPMAARSVGRSMRILKAEVSSMHDDEDAANSTQSPVAAPAQAAVAQPAPAPAPATAPVQPDAVTAQLAAEHAARQAQLDSLEQQIRELKESADKKASVSADQQPR